MLMLMGLSRFLLLRRLDQRPPRNDGKTIERGVAFRALNKSFCATLFLSS